jgi:hypothetical protein
MPEQPYVSVTDQFHSQNKYLQTLMDNYSVDNTKTDYILDQNQGMVSINSYLFIIYLLSAFIFCILLFITNQTLQIYQKVIISIFLLLIPFYIVRLETYIYSLLIYLRDLLYGNTYLRKDY